MLARSERFELPTLGIEIRCSIQLSYERIPGLDYQTWPDRASSGTSIAGVPAAILPDIGSRALPAVIGRGAVVIGKGGGRRAGPVIREVGDLVGQRPMIAVVVPVMARIRQAGRQGHYGEEGGGDQKPYFGHLDSPEVSLKTRHFWPVWGAFFTRNGNKTREKVRQTGHTVPIFGPQGGSKRCLTKSQHSAAKVLRSGPGFSGRPSRV